MRKVFKEKNDIFTVLTYIHLKTSLKTVTQKRTEKHKGASTQTDIHIYFLNNHESKS